MDIQITVNYTDDFNQPRTYSTVRAFEVLEAMPIEDWGQDGWRGGKWLRSQIPIDTDMPGSETFWQKVYGSLKDCLAWTAGALLVKHNSRLWKREGMLDSGWSTSLKGLWWNSKNWSAWSCLSHRERVGCCWPPLGCNRYSSGCGLVSLAMGCNNANEQFGVCWNVPRLLLCLTGKRR